MSLVCSIYLNPIHDCTNYTIGFKSKTEIEPGSLVQLRKNTFWDGDSDINSFHEDVLNSNRRQGNYCSTLRFSNDTIQEYCINVLKETFVLTESTIISFPYVCKDTWDCKIHAVKTIDKGWSFETSVLKKTLFGKLFKPSINHYIGDFEFMYTSIYLEATVERGKSKALWFNPILWKASGVETLKTSHDNGEVQSITRNFSVNIPIRTPKGHLHGIWGTIGVDRFREGFSII